ncbi:hypothetical protein EYF80_015351 [Liparis tanakae]|uniref:Uncharacterized protein n=1 Tax=Liparis tanakae TaxID=230148 RepID=A0A4Z2IAH1_9TELE|nr:hypothetical protein EYF80_015351 [Liparis tanakae]
MKEGRKEGGKCSDGALCGGGGGGRGFWASGHVVRSSLTTVDCCYQTHNATHLARSRREVI